MGAQPATPQAGLVAASPSGDALAPSSTISSPAPGASLPAGAAVTVTGTATDAGGGVVGGVEVSVDGGATWHPASGRGSWSYSWTPSASGPATIRSRAVDDSGRLEMPSAGVTVTIGTAGTVTPTATATRTPAPGTFACPCSLWNNEVGPALANDPDTASVELGVRLRADVDGQITGLRFYKGVQNTGTHTGRLWTATGQLLSTVTFSGETASGWQQVALTTPVAIRAGVDYVASYRAPNGHYSQDEGYFTTGWDAPPLRAPPNGQGSPNGVYTYGAPGTFPDLNFNSANYWVDVVFVPAETLPGVTPSPTATATATATPATPIATPTIGPSATPTVSSSPPADTTPPAVTAHSPADGATGVSPSAMVRAAFSEAMEPASLTAASFVLRDPAGAAVPAAVAYDPASRTATLDPAAPLARGTTYTATVRGGATDPRAKDLAGNALAGNVTWSFTVRRRGRPARPRPTTRRPPTSASGGDEM